MNVRRRRLVNFIKGLPAFLPSSGIVQRPLRVHSSAYASIIIYRFTYWYIYTHGDCIRIHAYAHMTTSELLRCVCRGGLPLGTNKALVFYRGDTFHKVGKLQN